ncbi:unnamed protein product [Clonostachys rosea f. rosea IK726]|uniref:Major facilitator superfamily (MFS) profile domain-containing protein n=2 Tax=Bionectria ochroleuca TaxID=29856 RepID=A0A0B7KG67_BIOOC|nr:unnamed protein product [Clonostachys rosea f. rosea IK726]
MAIGHKAEFGEDRLSKIAKADPIRWWNKPNLRFLYLILVPCGLGVEWTSGFDSSMMNSLNAVDSWVEYFNHPSSSRLGLLNAMYSLGALMAIPFVPTVSEYLGRRWTILTGSFIMMIGAGLQTGSVNDHMFLASRWVLGFGIPFAIVNASSMLGELGYEKERSTLTSLFNASWFVGAILAAGVTFGTFQMSSTWAWRIPSFLQLVPSLCQVIFMPFCPESPRWLISRDRHEEALEILKKYHSEGENGEEYVRVEYAQIQSTLAEEKERATSFVWKNVFRDAPMRRRFMLAGIVGFFTQWSGNGLISFYMKKILNLVGITNNQTVQKVILSEKCWGLINAIPIALIAPRFRRRVMFLICSTGTLVPFLCWSSSSSIHRKFYNIGWNALTYTYMVEIFPYQQRAQGIAVEQLMVRFAVFFNTYVNPIALDSIGWKYYIVYCVWVLFEIFTIWLLFPETHGRSLEELSFMFEDQAVRDRVDKNVEKVVDTVQLTEFKSQEQRGDKGAA